MTSKELQNKLSTRFNFDEWKDILTEMFPKVEFFTHVNPVSHDLVKDGGQTGIIRLDDKRSLAIYTFEVISVPLKSGQININQTIPEKGKN